MVQTSREDAAAAAAAALAAQWAPPAQQQGADAGSLGLDTFIVYHSKSGNMLTPANLGGMRAARPAAPENSPFQSHIRLTHGVIHQSTSLSCWRDAWKGMHSIWLHAQRPHCCKYVRKPSYVWAAVGACNCAGCYG